jgi:hypothetical protein
MKKELVVFRCIDKWGFGIAIIDKNNSELMKTYASNTSFAFYGSFEDYYEKEIMEHIKKSGEFSLVFFE